MRTQTVFFNALLVGSFLTACQSASTIKRDTTCAPPCWNMIQPGQTTRSEALERLQAVPEVDFDSLQAISAGEQDYIAWDFTSAVSDVVGRIYFREEKVLAIEFDTRGFLSVGDALAKLGEPEWVMAQTGCGGGRWLAIRLLNRTTGIALTQFEAYWELGEKAEVRENGQVMEVVYFAPTEYDEVLQAYIFLRAYDDLATFTNHLEPWVGYGEVAYIDICQ